MTAATDTVQSVLDRLQGVKSAGPGKWQAFCPVHEADGNGHTPSLSIGIGHDGCALVKCMAHCATADVVKALGLTMADLFSDRPKAPAAHRPLPKASSAKPRAPVVYPHFCAAWTAQEIKLGGWAVGVWKYPRDALRVVRFNLPTKDGDKQEKTFRPFHKTPDGWVCADPPGALPLYGVDELPDAGPICVCEGEKCVEAARSIDLAAVTSAHGAGAAEKSDWTPLRGRKIRILADNDSGGRQYAQEVAAILVALGCEVRIIVLPGLAESEDVADLLGPDGAWDAKTASECKAMIEALAAAEKPWTPPPADPKEHAAILRSAADVVTRPVVWTWPNRIPAGKLSLAVGHPGVAKTLLTVDMAARRSTGRDWPDGAPCEIGNTLFLSGEDDIEDTFVPRLRAAGADLSRITFLDGIRWRDPETKEIRIAAVELDRHVGTIREAIDRTQATLFVVDPVSSFLGQVDDHRNSELRALLSALAAVARDTGCAVLCISHLRKSGGLAVHQAVGSLAYTAAARAVWVVVADPQDAERRLLLPVKMNLCRDSTGLAFRVVSDPGGNGQPVLAWEPEPISMRADDVLNPTMHPGPLPLQRDEAAEWLTIALASGPRNAEELIAEAEAVGITTGTLRRAKETLGVKAGKDGFQGPWVWRLPKARAKDAQEGYTNNLRTFGLT